MDINWQNHLTFIKLLSCPAISMTVYILKTPVFDDGHIYIIENTNIKTIVGTHTHTHTHPCTQHWLLTVYHLAGLVVKASALKAADPGFNSCLHCYFSQLSHISDLKIDTPVATVLGTWHYRVSAGNSWPSISILWLGKIGSAIDFCLSVAACKN